MPFNEGSVTKGWLQKACRFSIRHTLKVRYFVLSDSELRYYKHPTDTQPAGIIELKNFHNVHLQNSAPLYGFRIISEHKNQWTPTLYAENHEERNMWVEQIQSRLNRLQSNMILSLQLSDDTSSSPSLTNQQSKRRRHSIHSHHSGMIDRWLDKFDLGDKQHHSIYTNQKDPKARSSIDTPTSQRSYDSLGESIYSESSSTINNNDSKTFIPYSMDSLILSTDNIIMLQDNNNNNKNGSNIISTSPTSTTNINDLEMERVIYLSHTTNRRSKSNQFHSEPIIPLSPPPRR